MNDEIILVNEMDEVIGYTEKLDAHRDKLLHRAFSIFIFDWNQKKMLLQRRAFGKYHSGGLWTNACCSHPRKGETMESCMSARLKEELGLETNLHIQNPPWCGLLLDDDDVIYSCGKFSYFASYGEICEYEIDHVFLYSPPRKHFLEQDFAINEQEVAAFKWVTIAELNAWLARRPETFTAWFRSAYKLAYEVLCRQADNMDTFAGVFF